MAVRPRIVYHRRNTPKKVAQMGEATATVIMGSAVFGKQLFDETGRAQECRGGSVECRTDGTDGRDKPDLWAATAISGLNGGGHIAPLDNHCITFNAGNNNAKCATVSGFKEGRYRSSGEALCGNMRMRWIYTRGWNGAHLAIIRQIAPPWMFLIRAR